MAQKIEKTRSAGGVVRSRTGLILVVNQNGNSWSLPKGHLEEGESALTAAKREICEETGVCSLGLVKELGTYERYRIGKDPTTEDKTHLSKITIFLFDAKKETIKLADPMHHPEARWIKKTEVEVMLTHPKDKGFFRSIIKEV